MTESFIRALGWLGQLSGVLLFLPAFLVFGFVEEESSPMMAIAFGVALCGVAVLSIYAGWLVRRLHPRGRLLQTFLALGALATAPSRWFAPYQLPFALTWTLLAYLVLWRRKSNVVFGEHYRTVVVPATQVALPGHLVPTMSVVLVAFASIVFGLLLEVI